jgi:thioredoxin reductase (NADPH)
MALDTSLLATRSHQTFPVLDPQEMERVRRFGVLRAFEKDEALATAGRRSPGVMVILSGQVRVTRQNIAGAEEHIVTYGPGGFLGGLEQLAGRPSLVDARATEVVSALVIAPELLRTLFIYEADLGERMMRALILRRMLLLEASAGGPVIVGYADDRNVLRLEGFLRRNAHPQQTLNAAVDAEAKALIERLHIDATELPVVLCPGGELLRNPTEGEVARCLGLVSPVDPQRTYDVAVVGAGPAGLSAAVYAASEGLSVLVLDRHAFGGQAGASMRIENYLGFPTGISGMALMARAYNQAQKFGVEMAIPKTVTSLEPPADSSSGEFRLHLAEDETVRARSVVIATGARYRRLGIEGLAAFEGSSVHYWASPLEGRLCAGQEVAVVGGGNSAGQAAMFLASRASCVRLVYRGRDLSDSMSQYLIERLRHAANVRIETGSQVIELAGDKHLRSVKTCDAEGHLSEWPVSGLFIMIGADPCTGWVKEAVRLDERGFILTGEACGADAPMPFNVFQTSLPGVFAVGDVRSGSVKRVASAVGEGSVVVQAIHARLASIRQAEALEPVIL